MGRKTTPGIALCLIAGSTSATVKPVATIPRTVWVEGSPPSIAIGGPNPARRKIDSN
jgi:hypothetical protein